VSQTLINTGNTIGEIAQWIINAQGQGVKKREISITDYLGNPFVIVINNGFSFDSKFLRKIIICRVLRITVKREISANTRLTELQNASYNRFIRNVNRLNCFSADDIKALLGVTPIGK